MPYRLPLLTALAIVVCLHAYNFARGKLTTEGFVAVVVCSVMFGVVWMTE